MSAASLYRLTKEDVPKAVECLKDAFKDDPLWTEVFKNDPHRDTALSGFFTCPLLYGIKFGKVYATSPKIEGVVVWVPGKYADMTMWRMIRCGALTYGAKMGKEARRNLSILSKQLDPDRKRLMKNKRYIYVTILGITSTEQGKGFGSKLMDAIQEECTREGLHLYLETEKEENLSFYEKHGLTLLQSITLEKIDLPLWQMERTP